MNDCTAPARGALPHDSAALVDSTASAAAADPKAPVEIPATWALTLRELSAPLAPHEILARLDRLAMQGKLPGFVAAQDGAGFTMDLFGEPFDRALAVRLEPADDEARPATRLIFAARLKWKLPIIAVAVVAFSIWPGVRLADGMIPADWGWWPTWWWYLPLTAGPLPLAVPPLVRRSEKAARQHAVEVMARIAAALGAERLAPLRAVHPRAAADS